MVVSGFTFVKNGLTLGYPIYESLKSIEPLCDEVIINVCFDDAHSEIDDGTYQYLRDMLPEKKFIFLKSDWKGNQSYGEHIYSSQTNYALSKCQGKICQYIQGDEVIHEKDLDIIENGHKMLVDRSDIDGLLFNYYHFYGNVDAYKHTRQIYKREVRTVKNSSRITSWKDAQGFRMRDGSKIKAKSIDAHIYHYGWARKETIMKEKIKIMATHYDNNNQNIEDDFSYKRIWGVKEFKGSHPKVMGKWVQENRNDINMMELPRAYHMGDLNLMVTDAIENVTGYRLGEYRNFKVVR